MSKKGNKNLVKKIKILLKQNLSAKDFIYIQARTIERMLENNLTQGINFQSGASWLAGKYTINTYWRFNYTEENDNTSFEGGSKRIGELTNQGELWLSFEPEEELERSFAISEQQILGVVIPRFEKYNSIEKLVKYYECNEISKKEAFGLDPGWACFNLGGCYYSLGKKQKAIIEFTDLVENHSVHPHPPTPEWMIKRKEKALEYIEKCKLLP